MPSKKEIELHYLNEARAASALFPRCDPVEYERPDFLLSRPSGVLGVEVTELCREGERGEGRRLGFVARRAKELYLKRSDARPVSVSPVFSQDAGDMRVGDLAAALDQFVFDHRDSNANFTWDGQDDEVPRGYSLIGVFPPLHSEKDGVWRYFRSGKTMLATHGQLADRIAEKNQHVAEYRRVAPEVWLLLMDDLFLGPGEVCVREEDLEQWQFDFDFDKVLLFERQPGGSGRVFELRRAGR